MVASHGGVSRSLYRYNGGTGTQQHSNTGTLELWDSAVNKNTYRYTNVGIFEILNSI